MNFLACGNFRSTYLLAPTKHWYQYISDNQLHRSEDFLLGNVIVEYIQIWAKNIVAYLDNPPAMTFAYSYSIASMIQDIHMILMGTSLEESILLKLRNTFPSYNTLKYELKQERENAEAEFLLKLHFIELDFNERISAVESESRLIVDKKDAQIQMLNKENNRLMASIKAYEESTSWKITAPIRKFKQILTKGCE